MSAAAAIGRRAIGIDLGGTEFKVALVDASGAVIACKRRATGRAAGPEATIASMIEFVSPFLGVENLTPTIGLCSPGPLNAATGVVIAPPTFPLWKDVPLVALLRERLGLPIVLDNDAHAAASGEWRFGAARGLENFVYLTISTGIGAGVVVDGRLLNGRMGLAGHAGHMTIGGHQNVVWEDLASGTALATRAEAALASATEPIARTLRAAPTIRDCAGRGPITGRAVGEAARLGDELALSLVAEQAELLGLGIVNLAHLFAPDRVIIGGGVSALFDLVHPAIARAIETRLLPGFGPLEVVRAELGGDAGVIGAAALAFDADQE